jgi:C-terminal processing protease CtpA/Prc
MGEDIDKHPIKRVVVDLRWNGGGDSRVISPLKKALAARPKLAGHVYVLIGPNTFSSALDNAMEWKRELRATLVGEPTGGKPGGYYGEVKKLTLPNSKLVVRYTSKYFGGPPDQDASSLTPDIAAPLTLGDLISGRDPALGAAITAK